MHHGGLPAQWHLDESAHCGEMSAGERRRHQGGRGDQSSETEILEGTRPRGVHLQTQQSIEGLHAGQ